MAALDFPQEERAAFLDNNCPPDLTSIVGQLVRGMTSESSDESSILNDRLIARAIEVAVDAVDSPDPEAKNRLDYGATFIGDYRLLDELGRGGMGVVFHAVNERLNKMRPVALKILKKDLVSSESILRFRRERVMLSAVASPSVPKLLDAGTSEEGRPYFVMEYRHGMPLGRFLTHADLPIKDCLQLFEAICNAVVDVHESLIIHRDIKPNNLFVLRASDGFQISLLDFGIATVAPELEAPTWRTASAGGEGKSRVSVLDLTHGVPSPHTPRYAAPEQKQGGTVTYSTDIYALGVLLHQMAATYQHADVMSIVEKASHPNPEMRFHRVLDLRHEVSQLRSFLP